eukprot:1814418-Karenia_brevis.AAC.1
MRAHVLEGLVASLRTSGYAGCEKDGMNSAPRVAERVSELRPSKYVEAKFTPEAILSAVDVQRKMTGKTLLPDKAVIPAEGGRNIED